MRALRAAATSSYAGAVLRGFAAVMCVQLPVAANPGPQGSIAELSLEELARVDVSAASLLRSSLLDAASSISAVNVADWERNGARRLLDALEREPSVMVLPSSSGNQVLAIRGYGRSTSYSGTATTWDGVPLNDLFRSGPQFNTPTINLGALSQIQLIQGPGSALYGSDAFHGLIALRGFEAQEDVARVSASAGSGGYAESALQYSRRAGAARLSLALAANGQPDQHQQARYTEAASGAEVVNQRMNRYGAGTMSLKFASTGALSWYGGVYLHRYASDQFQGFGARLSGRSDVGWVDTRFAMTQAGVRQAVGDTASVELKAYYWWVDNDLAANLQLASGLVRRDLVTVQHRAGLQAIYRDAWRAWNTELALALGSERLGVDRAYAELHNPQGQFLSSAPNAAAGANRSVRSATLEMNSDWAGKTWNLVYGARLDDYSDFGRHTSPRLGLVYHPAPDSAIKLLYGQAFRAPSAAEIGGAQNSILGNPALRPETIDSYELVAMRDTRHYLLQATLFRTFWQDGIGTALAPGSRLAQYQNVGRNDAYGASANLQYQAQGWSFDSALSYVRSRNSLTGDSYAIFPQMLFNVGVGRSFCDGACRVYLGQRWQSRRDDIARTEGFTAHPLPRYARTDVSVSRDFSARLSGTLQLRNLFDRANLLPSPQASLGGIPDEGFNVQAGLQYRF